MSYLMRLLVAISTVSVVTAPALNPLEAGASPRTAATNGAWTNPPPSVDYAMPAAPRRGQSRANDSTTLVADGEFTFTFDSPDYPWSTEDLGVLEEWTAPKSPYLTTLLAVAGPPPRDVTINIKRDPRIANAGQYRTGSMTLRKLELDVFLHEMSHAVHDDWVLSNQVWEEGLARATESQAVWSLEQQGFSTDEGDPHYDYPYDRYHDLTNEPDLGVQGGFIWGYGNRAMSLLRYENAGYAFGKALIEDPTFVRRFNSELFQKASGRLPESDLVALAAGVKPSMEGVPFAQWYDQRGVFDGDPPKGCRLFQRISQWTVDFFCRAANGLETSQAGAQVSYRLYDAGGKLLFEGESVTSPLGWASFSPALGGYTGRVTAVASASSPTGPVSSTRYRQAEAERGVFGVVTNATTGTVTLDSPDGQFPRRTVAVKEGAFVAEDLESFRGAVTLTFTGPAGTATRQITKAASPYGVSLTARDLTAPETKIGSGPKNRSFTLARSARLVFSANESPATFRCSLNGQVVACSEKGLTLRGLTESTHKFAVAGADSAGNRDPSPALRRWTVPVNNTRLQQRGNWVRRAGRAFYQGTYSQSRTRGAQLSRRAGGIERMALIASRGPGHGTVRVLLDGRLLRRVDLSSPELRNRQIIPVASFATSRSGKVRVVVTSSRKPVRIEGLGIATR